MFDFGGRHILVTGGTSGIGAEIAKDFAKAGATVTITGTKAEARDYNADLSAYRYLQLDLEDDASIDAVASAIPACDILVNNAGLAFYTLGLDEHDPDIFARAVRIHLTSAFRLSRRLQPLLEASDMPGGASIIGLASVTSFMGMSATLGYGAGKTGLLGMTRGLAVDLGPKGIRVNAVAAGMVESRMTAPVFEGSGWLAPTLARTPLGRLGQPSDISGAVLFLSSSSAGWITGQTIMVDGGYTVMG